LFGSKWELRFFSAWVILHFQQKDPGHSVQKFWNVEKKYLQVKFANLQWEFEEISNGNRGQKKKLTIFFCGLRYKAFTVVQKKFLWAQLSQMSPKPFLLGWSGNFRWGTHLFNENFQILGISETKISQDITSISILRMNKLGLTSLRSDILSNQRTGKLTLSSETSVTRKSMGMPKSSRCFELLSHASWGARRPEVSMCFNTSSPVVIHHTSKT
jgi:hypothetical protein